MVAMEGSQVDNVHGRYFSLEESCVIVFNRVGAAAERALVTEFSGACEHKRAQPRSRIRLAQDIKMPACNHIDKNQGSEVLQSAVGGQLFRHVSAAIQAVGLRPL